MSEASIARVKKTKVDAFANVAFGDVACSAANVLTFAAIQMAVGLFQGIAMVIHRIKYHPTAVSLREIVAATDDLTMAICTSNRLTGIHDANDPAIIDNMRIIGVGVAVEPHRVPYVSDFSSLPGGGKIVSANPLYCGIYTTGAVAASRFRVQLEFTFIGLSDRDYLEIIQSQFPANIS